MHPFFDVQQIGGKTKEAGLFFSARPKMVAKTQIANPSITLLGPLAG